MLIVAWLFYAIDWAHLDKKLKNWICQHTVVKSLRLIGCTMHVEWLINPASNLHHLYDSCLLITSCFIQQATVGLKMFTSFFAHAIQRKPRGMWLWYIYIYIYIYITRLWFVLYYHLSRMPLALFIVQMHHSWQCFNINMLNMFTYISKPINSMQKQYCATRPKWYRA